LEANRKTRRRGREPERHPEHGQSIRKQLKFSSPHYTTKSLLQHKRGIFRTNYIYEILLEQPVATHAGQPPHKKSAPKAIYLCARLWQ
jgi:hypothetical protein